jgi:hypothetical protein
MQKQNHQTRNIAIVCVLVLIVFFAGVFVLYDCSFIRWEITDTHNLSVGSQAQAIMGQTVITFPNGSTVMLEHHDANKTNNGLDWLVNRTTGFGNNASQTMIYVGWSNSSANCIATTTHISWIFNNSAGQGNGLAIKTLTASNWTRWATYGKFNLTARAYAAETISGIKKVFLAFKSAVYNCFVAIDIVTPTINLPSGSVITSTFVIQFS